jgi:protein SCO1/2
MSEPMVRAAPRRPRRGRSAGLLAMGLLALGMPLAAVAAMDTAAAPADTAAAAGATADTTTATAGSADLGGGGTENLPDELQGVGINEKLGTRLPLDMPFRDAQGKEVTLGQYFDGGRPVILDLAYYRCPMLCGLVIDGLVDAVSRMNWTVGDQFQIVTLSFDPQETPPLARLKKQDTIRKLGAPAAAAGWHFLTGQQSAIEAVTDSAGFAYRWNEEQQQFAHAAALLVCTPDGRVSRYLYGIQFDPQTLRLSMVEAGGGKVGSSFDRVLLFCFHYDAQQGSYGPQVRNLMKAGGILTMLVLGGVLLGFWRRERRAGRKAVARGAPSGLDQEGRA